MLICAISIICLAVVLVLVLVLKDFLRTYFKSLSLSLGVRPLSLSLGGRIQEVLVLMGQVLNCPCPWGVRSLSLGVRSLLTSLLPSIIVISSFSVSGAHAHWVRSTDTPSHSTKELKMR